MSSPVRVEITFNGSPIAVRDTADAFIEGLRLAQAAGRFPDVELIAGPTISSGYRSPPPITCRQAIEAVGGVWSEP